MVALRPESALFQTSASLLAKSGGRSKGFRRRIPSRTARPDRVERSPGFHEIERGSKNIGFAPGKELRDWITEYPEANNLVVAGMLLARMGLGVDASWWAQLEPASDSVAHETWKDAMDVLRRRRWQKHD